LLGLGSPKLIVLLLFASLVFPACGGSDNRAALASGDSGEPRPGETSVAQAPVDEKAPATSADANPDTSPTLGEPLDHPERYYGLYANPNTPNRQWFVTEAVRSKYAEQAPEVPPGHLAIGAMFGDVAPWHMKTLSDTEFEQAWVSDFQPEPVTVEFELGDDGTAVAMTFTNEQLASQGRLERQGGLPEGWE
jgi:hypothetical protein